MLIFVSASCSNNLRKVTLYNNHVILEIPAHWIIEQKDYSKYVDQQVLFENKLSDSSGDAIELKVYDSTRIYDLTVMPRHFDNFREIQLRTRSSYTIFINSEIIKRNNISIGVLKYVFRGNSNKMYSGARFFFKAPNKEFVEIEIYILNSQPKVFDRTINRIIQSLELRF